MTGNGVSVDGDENSYVERDEIYTLLSNRRRRNVIHSLLDDGPESTIGELATLLAAWENGCPPDEVTSKQRKRVYTALRQTHLPKLAEAGVLAYDEDRGSVELTPAGSELRKYLWHPHEVRWTRYYAAACALGVGLVGLSLVGVFRVPPAVLASLILIPFAVLTGANFARTRRAVRDAHARDADTGYATPSGPSWRSVRPVSDGGHDDESADDDSASDESAEEATVDRASD
ncbi:DUF7344 domain-containing protein [Candidatus Halobonum tyrrellensis]|nr:ArsR family transcriptional regulator [Candidatus Halobonum tyrrellensis]